MNGRKAMLWLFAHIPGSKKKMKRAPNVGAVRKLDKLLHDFKSGAANLTARMQEEGDSEFWVCLYFVNRTQREAFLASLGMDKDEKYVSAKMLADALGLKLLDQSVPVSQVKTAKALVAVLKPIPKSE